MIRNLIKDGRLPIGTAVQFQWGEETVVGRVRMSHHYWTGRLLVIVPEHVRTGYPRFLGKKAVDIGRDSVTVLSKEPWECGLCDEIVTDATLHTHACCGCGWRDQSSDGENWACPGCN